MFLRVAAEGSDFEGSIEREIAMGLTTRGIERPEDAALLLDHPDTAPAGLSGDEDDERDAKSLSVSSRKALSDFGVRIVSSSAALLLLIGVCLGARRASVDGWWGRLRGRGGGRGVARVRSECFELLCCLVVFAFLHHLLVISGQ